LTELRSWVWACSRGLARRFAEGRRAERRIEDVLRTLALLGQAERTRDGYLLSA
jgi:hypothetical protein